MAVEGRLGCWSVHIREVGKYIQFEYSNVRMFECWNGGLEGLGGLEFIGKRCPLSNSNSHYPLTTNITRCAG